MLQTAKPLSSRIVFVTGAASGLGKATAKRFLKNGARVVLCDLNEDSFVQDIDGRAVFVPTDVTKPDQVTNALDAAERNFGGPIDTVVNCAGIGLARKTISRIKTEAIPPNSDDDPKWRVHDLESFQNVLHVNVVGTFNVVRLAVERMLTKSVREHTAERGVIVNTASIAAYDGQIGQTAYASSKGAIVGMTLPLARDLSSQGIRVNAIAPGLFKTPLLEALPPKVQEQLGASVPFPSRLGDPDEYAALVQSIVENPMINGEVIRIDGGLRMPPS